MNTASIITTAVGAYVLLVIAGTTDPYRRPSGRHRAARTA